jgi:hypothetical protein
MVAAIHLLVALEKANLAEPLKIILFEYTLFPAGMVIVWPVKTLFVPVKSLGLVQVADALKLPDPVLLVVVCACTNKALIKNDMKNINFIIISYTFFYSIEFLNYQFVFAAL